MSSGPLPSPQHSADADRDGVLPPLSSALARGLADFAAAIGQMETVLAANEISATADVHFAAERIQDIAAALRRREVEAVLCDALEAATREVGDAIVRHDATSARAASAAALLKELAQRVRAMIAMVGDGGEGAAAAQRPCGGAGSLADVAAPPAAAETETVPHAPRPHDVAQNVAANVPALEAPSQHDAELPKPLPQTLPDLQARDGSAENGNELLQPLPLPIPDPLDGEKKNNRPPTASLPNPRDDARMPSRATSHESLAVLQTLSEEELIALFG